VDAVENTRNIFQIRGIVAQMIHPLLNYRLKIQWGCLMKNI
jgi:hypothetical protein